MAISGGAADDMMARAVLSGFSVRLAIPRWTLAMKFFVSGP